MNGFTVCLTDNPLLKEIVDTASKLNERMWLIFTLQGISGHLLSNRCLMMFTFDKRDNIYRYKFHDRIKRILNVNPKHMKMAFDSVTKLPLNLDYLPAIGHGFTIWGGQEQFNHFNDDCFVPLSDAINFELTLPKEESLIEIEILYADLKQALDVCRSRGLGHIRFTIYNENENEQPRGVITLKGNNIEDKRISSHVTIQTVTCPLEDNVVLNIWDYDMDTLLKTTLGQSEKCTLIFQPNGCLQIKHDVGHYSSITFALSPVAMRGTHHEDCSYDYLDEGVNSVD